MSIEAGSLDVERPGSNSNVTKAYTYTVAGNLETETVTYDDGETVKVWVKTYTYNGSGQLESESAWIRQ